MRKLLKLLMHPWEKRKQRKKELKKLLKNLGFILVNHKNTSIILGCLDFYKRKNGNYDIIDENSGEIVQRNVKLRDLSERMAFHEKTAKRIRKSLDFVFNNKITTISKKASKKLDDLVHDALKKWKNFTERPGAASVLEGIIDGEKVIIPSYTFKGLKKKGLLDKRHSLLSEWAEKIADSDLLLRPTHGRCAEFAAISEFLFKVEKAMGIRKNSITIEQARKALSTASIKTKGIYNKGKTKVLHDIPKPACLSCNPMLKYFNVAEIY